MNSNWQRKMDDVEAIAQDHIGKEFTQLLKNSGNKAFLDNREMLLSRHFDHRNFQDRLKDPVNKSILNRYYQGDQIVIGTNFDRLDMRAKRLLYEISMLDDHNNGQEVVAHLVIDLNSMKVVIFVPIFLREILKLLKMSISTNLYMYRLYGAVKWFCRKLFILISDLHFGK